MTSRTTRRAFAGGLVAAVAASTAARATQFTNPLPVMRASDDIYKPISLHDSVAAPDPVVDRPGPWGVSSRRFANALCASVFEHVNAERAQHGAPQLRPESGLAKISGAYSAEMIEGDFFGHYTPDGRRLVDRLRSAGLDVYSEVAENLWNAEGRVNWLVENNTQMTIKDWLNSNKGHREAMLDKNLRLGGVGAAIHEQRVVVAMLFARK